MFSLLFHFIPDFPETELEKLKRGDRAAFEGLFHTYARILIHFSLRIVNDSHLAENCVQDVFLHIWEHRDRIDPRQSIKSYLFTAVRNRALKQIRHEKVRREHQPEIILDPVTGPDQDLHFKELEAAVARAIAALPDKCRQIFEMNRFDALTYREIAVILNISVKTVETQMGRALKSLRRSLAPFIK